MLDGFMQRNTGRRRELLLFAGGLVLIILLAWWYLWDMASGMSLMEGEGMAGMAGMADMGMSSSHEFIDALSLFFMWSVMMVAMMLPSALPVIMVFLAANQRRLEAGRPTVSAGFFVLGYIAVWAGFSVLATLLQLLFREGALLTGGMALSNPLYSAGVLVLAGLFQWSPLKRRCLIACRSPLSFLMSRWRRGRLGAVYMGLAHGSYCVGCCWLLMALLFVAGVMNLVWVMVIAAFVLVEKILPSGEAIGRGTGVLLVGLGSALALKSIL